MWRHSVTSALASELVKNATSLYVPASVMTAALLHDVGRLVLAKALTPHMLHLIAELAEAENLAPLEAERAVLMTDHAELGAIAAEAWQLPDAIVEAIRHHHAPLQSSSPLATIVALSDELAHTTEHDDPYEMPNSATIAAIEALDIPPEEYGDMVASTIERHEQLAERFDA
jgi:putative nucleotidyltransferase with HDIG domain